MFSVLQSVVQSDSMLRACQVTAACQTFFFVAAVFKCFDI